MKKFYLLFTLIFLLGFSFYIYKYTGSKIQNTTESEKLDTHTSSSGFINTNLSYKDYSIEEKRVMDSMLSNHPEIKESFFREENKQDKPNTKSREVGYSLEK